MPPMYWSTGIQVGDAGVVGDVSFHGSVKRMKYQDESTKVSMVSVSRRAGPPHCGHVDVLRTDGGRAGCRAVGVTSSGSITGSSSSGTGTTPQARSG